MDKNWRLWITSAFVDGNMWQSCDNPHVVGWVIGYVLFSKTTLLLQRDLIVDSNCNWKIMVGFGSQSRELSDWRHINVVIWS